MLMLIAQYTFYQEFTIRNNIDECLGNKKIIQKDKRH